jgi:phosphoribosylanthranilate isomerase
MASLEEAQLAIRAGADAVGFVGVKPASPRTIDDRTIAAIAARVPPPVATFLLTSERTAEGVARHVLATGAPTPEYGGTGRTHDWSVSAEFVRRSPHPIFLAGGLSPGNVGEAIRRVRPFGVDLCSGVRTEGRLDLDKLSAFVEAVRLADADLVAK